MTTSPQEPRRLAVRELAAGRWLTLSEITYADRDGRPRSWEAAGRRHAVGAVVVVAHLRPSGRLLLVRQYRPPADGLVLEFPAGLLDAGESPDQCALRELAEETGYQGRVRHVTGPCFGSPGLGDETLHLALVDVDETLPANRQPTPHNDEGEHIETFAVAPAELPAFLHTQDAAGVHSDSRVQCYALALLGS